MGLTSGVVRSFFAVPLSVEAEQQLVVAAESLRRQLDYGLGQGASLRWIPKQNYHLTLAFLGDIPRRQIQLLHDIASEVVAGERAGELMLNGFEWFPSASKPRLLAAIPAPCAMLQSLQRQLHRRLNQQGFHLEKREFRPHVTLARIKGSLAPMDIRDEALAISSELDELVLFASTQGRNGSVYTPLFVEPIGA